MPDFAVQVDTCIFSLSCYCFGEGDSKRETALQVNLVTQDRRLSSTQRGEADMKDVGRWA